VGALRCCCPIMCVTEMTVFRDKREVRLLLQARGNIETDEAGLGSGWFTGRDRTKSSPNSGRADC